MKTKMLFTIVLALVMIFSIVTTVFAADTNVDNKALKL